MYFFGIWCIYNFFEFLNLGTRVLQYSWMTLKGNCLSIFTNVLHFYIVFRNTTPLLYRQNTICVENVCYSSIFLHKKVALTHEIIRNQCLWIFFFFLYPYLKFFIKIYLIVDFAHRDRRIVYTFNKYILYTTFEKTFNIF